MFLYSKITGGAPVVHPIGGLWASKYVPKYITRNSLDLRWRELFEHSSLKISPLVTNYPINQRADGGEMNFEMSLDTMKYLLGVQESITRVYGEYFLKGLSSTLVVTAVTENSVVWKHFDNPGRGPFSAWHHKLDKTRYGIAWSFSLADIKKPFCHLLQDFNTFEYWSVSTPPL